MVGVALALPCTAHIASMSAVALLQAACRWLSWAFMPTTNTERRIPCRIGTKNSASGSKSVFIVCHNNLFLSVCTLPPGNPGEVGRDPDPKVARTFLDRPLTRLSSEFVIEQTGKFGEGCEADSTYREQPL